MGSRAKLCSSPPTHPTTTTIPPHSWLGADPRHVDKYASLWRDLGWDTHVVVFDTRSCFTLAAAKRSFFAQATSLMATLRARAAADASTRLILHAFSNTGWLAYARFVQLLAAARAPVAGAVLDSCPHAAPSSKVWAAGFVTAVRPAAPPNPRSATYRAARLLMRVWLGWGTRKRQIRDTAADEASLATFDQTYIFSTTDHVIPAASVRAVVASRRATGVRVASVELAESPHVQHLRTHGGEYASALAELHARVVASVPPATAAPRRAARVLAALGAGRKPSLGRSLSLSALGPVPAATPSAAPKTPVPAPKAPALPPRGGYIAAGDGARPVADGGSSGVMAPTRSQSLGVLLTRMVL